MFYRLFKLFEYMYQQLFINSLIESYTRFKTFISIIFYTYFCILFLYLPNISYVYLHIVISIVRYLRRILKSFVYIRFLISNIINRPKQFKLLPKVVLKRRYNNRETVNIDSKHR